MTPVSKDILNALTTGINSEIASYVFYLEASKKKISADIRPVLEELALEEKRHFQILERQHHSLIKSEQWISLADVLKSKELPEINEEMSAAHRQLVDEVRKTTTIKGVLDIAYRLEVDAYELFIGQEKKAASDEGRKMFAELARFEQGHMRKIDEMRRRYA
ncbi:MAG: ferritin family protein [Candidatus Zixiibacteriota bacterium]